MEINIPGLFNLGVLSPSTRNDQWTQSKFRNAVVVSGLNEEAGLVKIVPTPGFGFYPDGHIKNAGICVRGSTIAKKVIRAEDLCGGVSIYRIEDTGCAPDKLAAFFAEKIKCMDSMDYSVCPPSECTDSGYSQNPLFQVHLGKENCSVGLYQMLSREVPGYALVVRSYDTPLARRLYNFIHDTSSTIRDVFSSIFYKDCLQQSDWQRDAIAYYVGKTCGFKMGSYNVVRVGTKTYDICSPMCTNRYNIIRPFQIVSDPSKCTYVFYDHCYSTKDSTKGIVLGMGRQRGYTWMVGSAADSNKSWSSPETLHVFPMGYPRTVSRDFASSVDAKYPTNNILSYGGEIKSNWKVLPELHPDCTSDTNWLNSTSFLGCKITTRDVDCLPLHCRISAQDPRKLNIREVIQLHDSPKARYVYFPSGSDFCTSELQKRYALAKAKKPSLRLTDLYKGETDQNYKLNKELLEELLKEDIE